MKKTILIFTMLAAVFLYCSCGEIKTDINEETSSKNTAAVTFTDDMNREVSVDSADRVCTMIGSFTDIWCLAGGKDSIVAAASDSWSSFDLGLSEDVADIGPVKEPNLEMIIASKPDFIICSSNTQSDVNLLGTFDSMGMKTAYFDIQNIDDYLNMLRICTDITGKHENYIEFGEKVKQEADKAIARADGSSPRILCARATGSSLKVKGSKDFLLGEMLKDLGCVNVADSNTSMLDNLSIEAIIKEDPDYIFIVLQGSDPTAAKETVEKMLVSNPAWAGLSAVKNGRFYTLEHELYNIKPNEKWGQAYEKLADILYG